MHLWHDDAVAVVGTVVVNDVDGGVVSHVEVGSVVDVTVDHIVELFKFPIVKPSVNILQPFLCFFLSLGFIIYFINLLNFYPVTRFLVTPLLVTALLCLVTPFCLKYS